MQRLILPLCGLLIVLGGCRPAATSNQTVLDVAAPPVPAESAPAGQASRAPAAGPAGGFNPQTLIEDMDADSDGRLSRDELQGPLQADFDEIDADQDGLVNAQELGAGIGRMLARQGGGPSPGAAADAAAEPAAAEAADNADN